MIDIHAAKLKAQEATQGPRQTIDFTALGIDPDELRQVIDECHADMANPGPPEAQQVIQDLAIQLFVIGLTAGETK